MLAIQNALHHLRRLPLLMLIGLAVMAAGGALDVILHLGPSSEHVHAGFGSEHVAHVIGIAGMVLVLAGVVSHGARRQHRQRADSHGGYESNAHR
jgi:hypothetical protein